MLFGRPPLLGLLVLLLAATAGCTSSKAPAGFPRADVAVPSYTPPTGAPGFCSVLAANTHLAAVPDAIGLLAATREDVRAGLDLHAAATELRAVLESVQSEGGHQDVGRALDDLIGALEDAASGTLTETDQGAVAAGLDDVGDRVQPLCGFPQ